MKSIFSFINFPIIFFLLNVLELKTKHELLVNSSYQKPGVNSKFLRGEKILNQSI